MIAISNAAGAARRTAVSLSCRDTRSETGAIAGSRRVIAAIAIRLAAMVISAGIIAAMNTSKIYVRATTQYRIMLSEGGISAFSAPPAAMVAPEKPGE
jgi:hypothetical protein